MPNGNDDHRYQPGFFGSHGNYDEGEPVPIDERPSAHRSTHHPAHHGASGVPAGGIAAVPENAPDVLDDTRSPLLTRRLLLGAAACGLIAVGLSAWGIASCAQGHSRGGGDEAEDGPGNGNLAVTETPVSQDAPIAVGTVTEGSQNGVATLTLDQGRTTTSGQGRVTFSAVGDNLANDNILALADAWSGVSGDGSYDFSPLYAEVAPVVQNDYDVSFISQETVLGGTETFGYMGYPSYNTPDSMADAVALAGWRVVNLGTNHTYDIWTDGIEHALGVWGAHAGLLTCGSYESEDDRQVVRMFECNGVRVAVLSYCYGQNGYELSDLPNNYYAVAIDEMTICADVARAREVADAVLVYMHWGTEYDHNPSDEQRYYAQVCADAGVDVVIGSHAHVIQPVEWIKRAGGGRMLCAFGLGDFVSGYHDNPKTVLSGMLSFDFARMAEDAGAAGGEGEASQTAGSIGLGGIAVENVVWHPLVEHMEAGGDLVRFVRTYTDEEAARNELLVGLENPRQWLVDTTTSVVGGVAAIDV